MRSLVIDDTPSIALVISGLLGDDFSVDEASDGIEAFLKAKSGTYDLALMDIRMPNFDGIQATISIRDLEREGNKSRMPIIGMSADESKDLLQRCHQAGMDDFLLKPFEGTELREKIRKCV